MTNNTVQRFMKMAVGLMLTVVLSLPVASPVAAAGNGAHVFKDSYCLDYEGSTICYDNMMVVHETTTPSGNTSFFGNGRSSYIQTDPSGTVVYQDSLSYHTHGLMMDSVLHEYGQFFEYSVSVGGGTCSIHYSFHFVDDQIQFERNPICS
jgi:hypothetical protein